MIATACMPIILMSSQIKIFINFYLRVAASCFHETVTMLHKIKRIPTTLLNFAMPNVDKVLKLTSTLALFPNIKYAINVPNKCVCISLCIVFLTKTYKEPLAVLVFDKIINLTNFRAKNPI